jgi:hypothetical protein
MLGVRKGHHGTLIVIRAPTLPKIITNSSSIHSDFIAVDYCEKKIIRRGGKPGEEREETRYSNDKDLCHNQST